MYLEDIEWGGVVWIDLAKERDQWKALVNAVMNLRVPKKKKAGKFFSGFTNCGLSNNNQFRGVSSLYLYIFRPPTVNSSDTLLTKASRQLT
jgi:hypothetical protein